jgi:UPF0755 protein
MINLYYKNRLLIQLFLSVLFLTIIFNSVTNLTQLVRPSQSNNNIDSVNVEVINVNIPQGSSASQIASILDSTGVVTSNLTFELYLRNENLTDKLRPGSYEIQNNLSYEEITSILLKGPPLKTYTITRPEGLWLSETLDTISAQTGYEVIQLENSLISGKVISKYLPNDDYTKLQNWEGLLFPNTYQIDIESNGETILQTLVSELETRYEDIISNNQVPNWIETPTQFFAVASLIEAEAKLDEDRPLVSSVIRNRLNDNMLLQIDATVLYSLQKRKSQVLLIDLQFDSPYNTYKYTSLPPTPISGFGNKSMKAIINTPENNYIYYLLTDVSGKMTFTNDYEEFINLKNKAKDEGVIP